jgi:bifunctional non-homologous end joining protein LigD
MATTAARSARLSDYNKKRDFTLTREPRGKVARKRAAAGPIFVVQKHAASHLHYDFRLEHNGVLLSWAVPKGPSVRAGERRLAMRTEDHPLDYATFEGTIPEGEYGGGRVLVWDYGTWEVDGDAERQVEAGRLTFALQGKKLHGRFHLVRSKGEGKRERWLLFKGKDAGAHDIDIVEERPESVLSGNTIDQVGDAVWHSNRVEKRKTRTSVEARAAAGEPNVAARATVREPKKVAGAKSPRGKRKASDDGAEDPVLQAIRGLKLGFPLTNLEKVLYAEQGLRKADLIAYYAAVAPRMLPHVQNRPLVLVRCPDGQGHKCFYQKHFEKRPPRAIHQVTIDESEKQGRYGYVRDRIGLAALAQLGVLEIHLWGCHVDRVEKPDLFVFDLDPDEDLPWQRVVSAAQSMRERLSALSLQSFVKTTGGKGLHVVVPIVRKLSWDEHKAVSYAIVSDLARSEPELYVTNMSKKQRTGKIFLDYLRNGRGATAIAPYSTRARAGALVATPLRWEELADGARPSDFDVAGVVERLRVEKSDPWQGFFELSQRLSVPRVRALVDAAERAAR